jgi:2',3'-cyclic-nucleotide 2'-phosphodiesterase (5'-nucleotidase family)
MVNNSTNINKTNDQHSHLNSLNTRKDHDINETIYNKEIGFATIPFYTILQV